MELRSSEASCWCDSALCDMVCKAVTVWRGWRGTWLWLGTALPRGEYMSVERAAEGPGGRWECGIAGLAVGPRVCERLGFRRDEECFFVGIAGPVALLPPARPALGRLVMESEPCSLVVIVTGTRNTIHWWTLDSGARVSSGPRQKRQKTCLDRRSDPHYNAQWREPQIEGQGHRGSMHCCKEERPPVDK